MKIICKKKQTIKECLKENNVSRHFIRSIKTVMVNDLEKRLWEEIEENQVIEINIIEESMIVPTEGNLNIIYEDDDILVVNKPHDMASMPNRGHYRNSLANYVKYYFETKKINSTIHLVNRLDYLTSGLVLIAKNKLIHALFSKIEIKKKYYAVVNGIIESGIIEKPISKIDGRWQVGGDAYAKTKYEVLEQKKNTLLDIELFTGRTHQIRAHMQFLNHSIIGDKEESNLALQSYFLEFIHPVKKEKMTFVLELEDGLKKEI